MAADGEYFFNGDVEVTNELTIAARGLTPNHIGKQFIAYKGYYEGEIHSYSHVDGATILQYKSKLGRVEQVKFATLDLLTVTI